MPKYRVLAFKTLDLEAVVEATTAEEALRIVDEDYLADDFFVTYVEFKLEPYEAYEVPDDYKPQEI